MANSSSLSVPSTMSKKIPSSPGLNVLTPAPSLLSLRSVIDFMPSDIRLRYKDAAKYAVWPECPLDGNGQAVEINEEDELDDSNAGLNLKLKRNITMNNGLPAREYSKFGNAPVMVAAALKPTRNRRTSENAAAGYQNQNWSPLRSRKAKPAGPSVAYFSSKDGGDVDVRVMTTEMTRL